MLDPLIFDEEFLQRLQLLQLVARRLRTAGQEGQKAGSLRGGRIEFSDHRRYSPGDDYRYIDWAIYGRLEKLFIKEFAKEEDQLVCFLLDESRSMEAGRPAKRHYGARLAAALAFIALAGENRVRLGRLADGEARLSDVFAGDNRLFDLLDFLSRPFAPGATDLNRSLGAFYRENRRPGLTVLISDLFDEGEPGRMFQFLSAKGYDLVVVHLLAREELRPAVRGRLRLTDRETGERLELAVGKEELAAYGRAREEFIQQWRRFCLRHDVRYLAADTDQGLEPLVLRYLREEGFVR